MLRSKSIGWQCGLAMVMVVAVWSQTAHAQASEDDYYKLITYPIPDTISFEVGAVAVLPGGRIAASTRRGDIFIVEGAYESSPKSVKYSRFASGLHEVLGLEYRDGWLYATQRCELSRLKDLDNDGQVDLVETVNDGWEINGDYHEYAFGSEFDRDGNLWVVLCLTGSFTSDSKYRGWCVRINELGELIPTCSGLRSPGGIGMNSEGDMFYTDNQGPWNGTCSLKHLKPGSFQGHPGGNKWYQEAGNVMGAAPLEPESGSRLVVEAERIPELVMPAVLFPYKKMGQSASGVACDVSGGFGPFKGQMFVGDQTFSSVMRVALEKVNGVYQGACFRFREGLDCGALALKMAPDGSLIVGATNRGWGSRGTKPYALHRIEWTGELAFEVERMNVEVDGFEFVLTRPVDRAVAQQVENWGVKSYTYIYQSSYGSPEVDHRTPGVTAVAVSEDGRRVKVRLSEMVRGHVYEFDLAALRSRDGNGLLHPEAYYTLNEVPAE